MKQNGPSIWPYASCVQYSYDPSDDDNHASPSPSGGAKNGPFGWYYGSPNSLWNDSFYGFNDMVVSLLALGYNMYIHYNTWL